MVTKTQGRRLSGRHVPALVTNLPSTSGPVGGKGSNQKLTVYVIELNDQGDFLNTREETGHSHRRKKKRNKNFSYSFYHYLITEKFPVRCLTL